MSLTFFSASSGLIWNLSATFLQQFISVYLFLYKSLLNSLDKRVIKQSSVLLYSLREISSIARWTIRSKAISNYKPERKISNRSNALHFREACECQMLEMVTSVKFARETRCVNTGLTFNFRSLRSLGSLKVKGNLVLFVPEVIVIAAPSLGSLRSLKLGFHIIAGIAELIFQGF